MQWDDLRYMRQRLCPASCLSVARSVLCVAAELLATASTELLNVGPKPWNLKAYCTVHRFKQRAGKFLEILLYCVVQFLIYNLYSALLEYSN